MVFEVKSVSSKPPHHSVLLVYPEQSSPHASVAKPSVSPHPDSDGGEGGGDASLRARRPARARVSTHTRL
jgi:hypothetical protein